MVNCKIPTLCVALLILTGCASLPYKDTFDCPQMEGGRCISVVAAHADAAGLDLPEPEPSSAKQAKQPAESTLKKEELKETSPSGVTPTQSKDKDAARLEADIRREDLRLELLEQYAGAVGQKGGRPAVLLPPVVMETAILPYQTGFEALAGERTLWLTVEEATWVWPDRFDGKADRPEIGSVSR